MFYPMAIFQSQGHSATDPEAWDVPIDAKLGSSCDGHPRGNTFAVAQMSWPVSSRGSLRVAAASAYTSSLLVILGGWELDFYFLQQENHLKMWNIALVILGWKMIYIAQKRFVNNLW